MNRAAGLFGPTCVEVLFSRYRKIVPFDKRNGVFCCIDRVSVFEPLSTNNRVRGIAPRAVWLRNRHSEQHIRSSGSWRSLSAALTIFTLR